jgi:hypothetical protein
MPAEHNTNYTHHIENCELDLFYLSLPFPLCRANKGSIGAMVAGMAGFLWLGSNPIAVMSRTIAHIADCDMGLHHLSGAI